MFLEIEHHLSLEYDAYVRESFLELRMQPKTDPHQTLHSFVLAVGPPSKLFRYRDWLDNAVHHFAVSSFHNRIAVVSRSLVNTHPAAPAPTTVTDPMPLGPAPWQAHDFLQLGGPVVESEALRDFADAIPVLPGAPLGHQVLAIGAAIKGRFTYRKDVTRYDSTTEDLLRLGAGVCQDFTHLMLGLLRRRAIPCRYVSGYLHMEQAGPETAQSHAWIEFFSPIAGWVPFDPTHDRAVDERYVVVGHGRDYDDVPPNKGIFRGSASEQLQAEVRTRVSAHKAISTLHEEVEQIDLPVFQEIPERKHDWVTTAAQDAASQQQQ